MNTKTIFESYRKSSKPKGTSNSLPSTSILRCVRTWKVKFEINTDSLYSQTLCVYSGLREIYQLETVDFHGIIDICNFKFFDI